LGRYIPAPNVEDGHGMKRRPTTQKVSLGRLKSPWSLRPLGVLQIVLDDLGHCVSSTSPSFGPLDRWVLASGSRAKQASSFPPGLFRRPWSMPADRDKPLPSSYAVFDDIRSGVLLAANAEPPDGGVPQRLARAQCLY
jgi:hypothetical protein